MVMHVLQSEEAANAEVDDEYIDEDEDLKQKQNKLKQKLAWRKRVNMFTGRRHISKRNKQ